MFGYFNIKFQIKSIENIEITDKFLQQPYDDMPHNTTTRNIAPSPTILICALEHTEW